MKKPVKVYLSVDTINRLKIKSQEVGISGRGWLSAYLCKISNEDIVFMDQNVKRVLKSFYLG